MNRSNITITQKLWSEVIAVSPANNICSLICATMSENKGSDIVDMLNVIAEADIPKEKLQPIIDIIEGYYIDGFTIDLAPYLSVLYYRNNMGYLSKYYLGLIRNATVDIEKFIKPLATKYASNSEPICDSESISLYNLKNKYKFHGKNKEYSVYSFSKNIGKNLTILKTPYGAIMFDCGAECGLDSINIITEIELLKFFRSIDISPDDLLAVIISHAHLDHYGSIATLIKCGIDITNIYIEDDTKALIQQVATDIPSLEKTLPIAAFYNTRIKISAFPNGHILGSTGYIVTFDEINVVYTGDYCLHSQKTVPGLNIEYLKKTLLYLNMALIV